MSRGALWASIVVLAVWTTVGLTGGCASLASFTDKAAAYQREVEATLMAAQAVAEECRGMPEPKPELCVQVEKLLALVEPEAE